MALYSMSLLFRKKTLWKFVYNWDTLTPWVCSIIPHQNQSSCFTQLMTCNGLPAEPLRQWSYAKKPLSLGLLPLLQPTSGLIWQWCEGNLPKPYLHPQRGEPHLPTGNPQPGGGTLPLQAELGNLTDQELYQLLEDLHQVVALCELNAPPEVLHQDFGKTHKGMEVQIRMTRRSPFLEGQGWFPLDNPPNPKTAIPTTSPYTTRWRTGSWGTTSSTPSSCPT